MTQCGEAIFSDTPPPEPEEKEEKGVKIRFSIFFDGTLNNRTNTESRLAGNDIYQQNKAKGDDNSYGNDKSNVAKMETYIDDAEGFDHTLHAYIEGAGTIDNQGDSTIGAALGTGETGVKRKVDQGMNEVVLRIMEHVKHGSIIDELVLDTFGFSRGAAGARFFVHKALSETPIVRGKTFIDARPLVRRLRAAGYEIENENVKFKFVGLYDTVAAEGIIHRNDTWSLKLDSIGRSDVEKVVQLASADEHRANFSLTSIESACGKGEEVFLPGVHSDIGGGYRDNKPEDLVINESVSKRTLEEDRNRLIAQGWYKEDEIWIESPEYPVYASGPHADPLPPIQKLIVHRDKISNRYDRIPLHIMASFARKAELVLIDEIEDNERVPSDLSHVYSDLAAYAQQSGSNAEDWAQNSRYEWLNETRNNYFHFSAHYTTAALVLTPHKPNFEGGQRARINRYG